MDLNPDKTSLTFGERVEQLTQDYATLWKETPAKPLDTEAKYSPDEQRANELYCDQLVGKIEDQLATFPTEPQTQQQWRLQIGRLFREFCQRALGYSDALTNVLFTAENIDATREFVRRAKAFDESINIDDLHQALRNVWVMNSIQTLLGQDVTCSESVFAYSMLYPYTDNYLDDTELSPGDKRDFNEWLESRLKGSSSGPRTVRQRALSDLVACIESDHKRDSTRNVYDSLLAIHSAQRDSLQQQQQQTLTAEELLAISIRKGGTSVLAHGYLLNPETPPLQADFIFGYGVFLQLLDDLQDVGRDHACQHSTLFTDAVRRNTDLDSLADRMFCFMHQVLERVARFSSAESCLMRELIFRNCVLLMHQSIARHQTHFSDEFLRLSQRCSPLGYEYLSTSSDRLQRSFQRAKLAFARQHGDTSIYSVLG